MYYRIHAIMDILPNKPRKQAWVIFKHILGLGTKGVPKSVPGRVGIRQRRTELTYIWCTFSWTRFRYAFRTYSLYPIRRECTCDTIYIITENQPGEGLNKRCVSRLSFSVSWAGRGVDNTIKELYEKVK